MRNRLFFAVPESEMNVHPEAGQVLIGKRIEKRYDFPYRNVKRLPHK